MKNSLLNHLKNILILPFTVTILIPFVLLYSDPDFQFITAFNWIIFLGISLILLGLMMLIITISLFKKIGRGTLANWDPTENLVRKGPYKYSRNPMISGVLFILLGETFFFYSSSIFVWFLLFFIINTFYITQIEEPDLLNRFGEDYKTYRESVPRWIPKIDFKRIIK